MFSWRCFHGEACYMEKLRLLIYKLWVYVVLRRNMHNLHKCIITNLIFFLFPNLSDLFLTITFIL